MSGILEGIERALGTDVHGNELTTGQMVLRAILVFVVWLVIVRLADRRLLGKYSAFDVVLAVMLGAVLGRTINGSAPLWGTLAASAVLVALHGAFAFLASRWPWFGSLIKGQPRELVRNGIVDEHELRRNFITRHDLDEMLRLHGRIDDVSETALAVLERNGQISAIPRSGRPPKDS